ncbi:response regulator [Stenotrophomonas indicatrix]|uniref:response regulator n=1 Tax=Stenotrophomonas indicatrix TaxID=2045451 RepID=UPI00264B3A42|nr:response regulator [Stenotrophomonas indicatrix]MDN8646380.1 response regulator [Stenotrophomonas indicatrix]MDN8656437.1 response regulator [Stenotrophomonas indicatrix]
MNVAGSLARIVALSLLSAPAWAGQCEGPILLAYPDDRAPLSSSLDGTPQGLVAAYLALLQEQVPTLRATPVAATALAAAALPAGTHAVLGWPRAQTPEGWVASVPYLQVPQVIVRRPDALPIHGLDGLHGRGVASLDTVPLAGVLEESGAHVPLLQVAALDKALQLLISGQIDAVVGNLVEVEAALRDQPGGALDVAAPAGFSDALVLAALPACAHLVDRFNQLQAGMTEEQREALRAHWVSTSPRRGHVPPVSPLRGLIAVLLMLLTMGLVHAFGYWRLHREGLRRQALEQRLQEVTANLPAVVYQARRSSTGEYSVPHIAGDVHALFGISVDTARVDHGSLLAAVHPQDRRSVLACVDAAALVRGPIDITFRTRGPNGWRWVRSHGRPIACSDSGVEWSGYWMDVTEARARTQALNDARRDAEQDAAAKSHFLATMSHEIRTPMSTMLGMLERFGNGALDGRQRQVLATIDDAAQMLRQILDDVLHSQRLQSGPQPPQCLPTDLAGLLRAVQRLLVPVAASKGLHLRCEVDPTLQRGSLADALRLRQILFNLAGNALKFTLHGGVDLQVRVLQQRAQGQQLRLQVTDTGVGISRERQRAVFAAFTQADASTTRRFGGSGLGLAICRELAASMGGQLHLCSTPGVGTTVWLDLYLPACEAPSVEHRDDAAGVHELPPVRVLVAEDHPTNLQLLVRQLRDLGLQVHAAANGEQAWQAWQTQRFALVITDCHMPGMDGFALARAIRADPRADAARVPIIALTASVLDSTRQACHDAGIDHFIAKPVDRHALHAALAAVLMPLDLSVRQ